MAVTEETIVSRAGIGGFGAEAFGELEMLMGGVRLKAGSCLFWEGDPADFVYYVRSGKVKLQKSTEDGRSFLLSIAKAGDWIGEPSFGAGAAYGCSAEAVDGAELGAITVRRLEALLTRRGDIAVSFLGMAAAARRIAESKLRDLLLFGKPGALASTLIRLANGYGIAGANGIRIGLKLTNAELAEFIGASRENVNRMLHAWEDEGTLALNNGRIEIRDLPALRKLCGCPSCPACPKEVCRI